MDTKQPKTPKTESIALRAFSILEYIVEDESPVSLDDVARECNLPKPTAFRILDMLREAGLLQRDPEGKRYVAGTRLTAFAFDVLQHSMRQAECHYILKQLVAEIGETCNITILDGNEVLYLDRVETNAPLRLALGPGTRVPLHCTAAGKLFLSRMSPKQMRRLLGDGPYARYTDNTITDPDELNKALDLIRESGIGTHDSERFENSVAMAVPIGGHNKRVFMAVAVHGPTPRVTMERCKEEFLPALRRAAEALTSILVAPHP